LETILEVVKVLILIALFKVIEVVPGGIVFTVILLTTDDR
jgi:hypothetical protein